MGFTTGGGPRARVGARCRSWPTEERQFLCKEGLIAPENQRANVLHDCSVLEESVGTRRCDRTERKLAARQRLVKIAEGANTTRLVAGQIPPFWAQRRKLAYERTGAGGIVRVSEEQSVRAAQVAEKASVPLGDPKLLFLFLLLRRDS